MKNVVFKNRNFAIVFSGQIISKLGNNLYLLALPWYVYSTTGSKSLLALTGFLQSVPVILGLFVGVFVDRWNKRLTLITVDSFRIVIAAAMFLVVFVHGSIWLVIVLVLLLESVGKFYNPATASLIPLIVPIEDIVAAQGLAQSGSAMAQLVAMFGGGALMQLVGPGYLFLGNAIAFLCSVLSLVFVKVDEHLSPAKEPSLVREWVEGLSLSFRSRKIAVMMIAVMVSNFAFAAFDIITTAWIKGPVHGNAVTLGLFGGLFFAGVIVGGVLLGTFSRHFDVVAILIAGLILTGGLTCVMGVSTRLWWMLPIVAVMGFANGLMNGSIGARFIVIVPEQMRGRIFGTLGAVGGIMAPVGMAIYGWLLTQLSLSLIFVLIGLPVVLSGLSLLVPTDDDSSKLSNIRASAS